MKLLFCYDGALIRDEKNKYYGRAINNEMLSRYEAISDNISIAIRVNKSIDANTSKRFSEINKEKYNIIECPNLASIKGIVFNRKRCKKILEEAVKSCDYIIARLPSWIGNLSITLAKKLGKPYLIELVGCPWDAFFNLNLKGKFVAPYMTLITRYNVKNAPYVLYVTEDFLQRRYPTKGKSISCSNVILNDLNEENLAKRKRIIQNNKQNEKMSLCTTGAINVKFKGQKYVIKAISKLKKQGLNYKYYVIGDGDNKYLNRIIKKYKLENDVFLYGAVKHEKVFEILDNIDIYIQPSKQEGLPRALIEAMSRGCPCIGSTAGGIPELLEHKVLFKKGNVKQLIKILKNMTTEIKIEQSQKNFIKSKEYKKEILEKRRTKFYTEFVNNK